MKCVLVMYDTLRRDMLGPYGCSWTITPNFDRLAGRSVVFDQSWVGSMPCMPARRELQSGRPNFYHRSWGPMEPFDDSFPEILRDNGIYTHLVSDHQHYWEDGGCTYHNRYSSWQAVRGQEGDRWHADLGVAYDRKTVFEARRDMKEPSAHMFHDAVNRTVMDSEERTCQSITFREGLAFIERNHGKDDWFLQIETFDPHEPFYTLADDKAMYPYSFVGDAEYDFDWPPYAKTCEDEETVRHVRYEYAALVTKCDRYLGKVLDAFDRFDLWKDTMLIVATDHGFLLGEHGWWGKTDMPMFTEISRTPLFIYDPRHPEVCGLRRQALVQLMDLAPTILSYFSMDATADMLGHDLEQTIMDDHPVRQAAVFGYHGSQVCATDGRHLYMHSALNPQMPVYEYTLMPTHMRRMFSPDELGNVELAGPFGFTKGCRVMKIEAVDRMGDTTAFGSALYDLEADPGQERKLDDERIVRRMRNAIRQDMDVNDAPGELYERLGL